MLVLLIWGAAVLVALVVLAVLGYELVGHLRRLLRTVTTARDEVLPALRQLNPPSKGRHRAGVPRP